MRTDIVVGAIVSAALHGTLLLNSPTVHRRSAPVEPPPEETVRIEMPPLPPEEEETEKVEELQEQPQVQSMPPTLVETPSPTPRDFEMPILPPVETGLPPGDINMIPVTRNYGPPTKGMPPIFNPGDLEQQPQLRAPVAPAYPFEMRRAGITGNVIVEFIVDSHGRTHSGTVVQSTHREFEKSALEAVQKWQFKPGRKGGRAVNTRVQQLITYDLNES